MGFTLKPSDFVNVLNRFSAVAVGVVLQFTIMPLVALSTAILLNFDADLTVGLVLVGCVAGGTSSNVMCFLSKGDVAHPSRWSRNVRDWSYIDEVYLNLEKCAA